MDDESRDGSSQGTEDYDTVEEETESLSQSGSAQSGQSEPEENQEGEETEKGKKRCSKCTVITIVIIVLVLILILLAIFISLWLLRDQSCEGKARTSCFIDLGNNVTLLTKVNCSLQSNETAEFKCQSGYTAVSGNTSRTCTHEYKLTGKPLQCFTGEYISRNMVNCDKYNASSTDNNSTSQNDNNSTSQNCSTVDIEEWCLSNGTLATTICDATKAVCTSNGKITVDLSGEACESGSDSVAVSQLSMIAAVILLASPLYLTPL